MNADKLIKEKITYLIKSVSKPEQYPVSVYRLQFNAAFTFRDAAGLVPYLHELGITDCYASPYLKARRGSKHGYDISDQNSLNPEVGSEEEYQNFVNQLHTFNMGQILDFVPNHMSIFDNPKWQDVLENGPSSIFARFFDINWKPPKVELHQKVLLPILENLYGTVLESGLITLVYDQGAFFIKYRNHRLPVAPETTVPVLESALKSFWNLCDSNTDFLEMQSIIKACQNLPGRSEIEPEIAIERYRNIKTIKKRLRELCHKNVNIKSAIEKVIITVNGCKGGNQSFFKLHEMLERQSYRLSFWKVATEEINYRRFFDVNDMVALRMEDPIVFEETHRLIKELFARGLITGIRIDHIDGLFDPRGYLNRLQKDCWLELIARKLKREPQFLETNLTTIKNMLMQKFSLDLKEESGNAFHPVYIIVEKILGDGENLSGDWPVEGTTGYEFLAALNGIFVDNQHNERLLETYRLFTNSDTLFDDVAYRCKNLVMRTSLASEVNMLADLLNKISEKSWEYRDLTLNTLHEAIREVIACFPVYRTYINAYTGFISQRDEAVINSAIIDAKRRNPTVSSVVFNFVRDTLLMRYPEHIGESGRDEHKLFVMRFQQFTGPVMAKGVEDTAFYIYNPLVSLNEVGGNPRKLGTSLREFHNQNISRQKSRSRSLISTSTHDSKRGEDVRARINVLSEIPEEWGTSVYRWSLLNKNVKSQVNHELVPDKNDEYLLYQTLIGTYPLDILNEENFSGYIRRIQNYILKAVKEAKVHTSWISQNTDYEDGVASFVEAILNQQPDNLFLDDFKHLNRVAAICGMYNSLSQVVLKAFSPGVPDIYQGNELWALNLTDPDNRIPVNYTRRAELLRQLREQAADRIRLKDMIKDLVNNMTDGRIKLYITWKSMNYRRDNNTLFEGTYHPLVATGPYKNHLCAFAWMNGGKNLIVVVPRFLAQITHQARIKPFGEKIWGDTHIVMPQRLRNDSFKNVYTGEVIHFDEKSEPILFIGEVFKSFPVAVLESG